MQIKKKPYLTKRKISCKPKIKNAARTKRKETEIAPLHYVYCITLNAQKKSVISREEEEDVLHTNMNVNHCIVCFVYFN